MGKEEFAREMEARLAEVEELAREGARRLLGARRPQGPELKLVRFSRELRLLPKGLEDSIPLLVPRGVIYGLEAIAVVGGREVPLGATIVIGMYDDAAGEGVAFEDYWIDLQLNDVLDLLREAAGLAGDPDYI